MLTAAATFAVAFQAGPARACFIHVLGENGFSVEHRGVLSVAVALKQAQDIGMIEAMPENPDVRAGKLLVMNWGIRAYVEALADANAEGPPIYVLLTQSGAWLRMNDPGKDAEFHADPPKNDEVTILLPDTAMLGLLDGSLSGEELFEAGLLRIYAESSDAALGQFISAVSVSHFMR